MKKKLIALMMVAIMLLSLIPVSNAADSCVHNFQWVTKNATCTANGARQFKCTKCGVVATTQTINALGHDWNPATCTSARKCKRCGITSGGPLGHSLTAATCTSPKKCLRCGQTFGTIPQHRWEPATCTAAKKCKGCGRTSGDPLGHSWSGWTVYKSPTSATQGIKKRTCTRCGIQQTVNY